MKDHTAPLPTARLHGSTSVASRAAAVDAGLDVRVWGARGSLPYTGPDTLRYGGDTCGVEIRLPGRVVYFDAGSASPKSGAALLADGIREVDLFLSHVHYDHIMGMPFFPPVFRPDVRLRVWYGGAATDEEAKAVVANYFRSPYFPAPLSCVRADISFHAFRPGDDVDLGDVRLATSPPEASGRRHGLSGRARLGAASPTSPISSRTATGATPRS